MTRVIFLVEERSMSEFLGIWIPRTFPNLPFLCLPHEGKRDLMKSIPRKIKAWREPGVKFIVIIDNDGLDCRDVKTEIVELCQHAGREDVLVRIACQELEAWYLGDPVALATAFNDASLPGKLRKKRFRDPDMLRRPSEELVKIVPSFQKVSGARSVAAHIDSVRNSSQSFRMFAAGIQHVSDSCLSAFPQ